MEYNTKTLIFLLIFICFVQDGISAASKTAGSQRTTAASRNLSMKHYLHFKSQRNEEFLIILNRLHTHFIKKRETPDFIIHGSPSSGNGSVSKTTILPPTPQTPYSIKAQGSFSVIKSQNDSSKYIISPDRIKGLTDSTSTTTTTISTTTVAVITTTKKPIDPKIEKIQEEIKNKTFFNTEEIKHASENLKNITKKEKHETSAAEIHATVAIITQLVDMSKKKNTTEKTSPEVQKNFIAAISNVLEVADETVLQKDEDKQNVSQQILTAVDTIVESVDLKNGSFEEVQPNLAIVVVKFNTKNDFSGLTFSTDNAPGEKLTNIATTFNVTDTSPQQNNNDISKDKPVPKKPRQTKLSLPPSIVKHVNSSDLNRISFVVYTDNNLFTPKKDAATRKPAGLILSISIPGVEVKNLEDPIKMSFAYGNQTVINPACSYWGVHDSIWKQDGCRLQSSSTDEATCACNHMTNFALLMDVYQTGILLSEKDKQVFTILSYTGCSVSIVALLITIGMFLAFQQTRNTRPGQILINLCLALVGANITFVAGEQQYVLHNEVGCKIVAALLHFFLLCCFAWMSLEAINMYLFLVKVISKHIGRFLLKVSVIGWGIPLLIVVITLGTNFEDSYGLLHDDICWLSNISFYVAFLMPVSLVILFNAVVMVLVIRKLHSNLIHGLTKSTKEKTSARLKRIMGIFILLGLTWAFAFLAVNDAHGFGLTFQYLFTIFNSLQGLFIFVFYVLFNNEMHKMWRGAFGKKIRRTSTWTSFQSRSFTDPNEQFRNFSETEDIPIANMTRAQSQYSC